MDVCAIDITAEQRKTVLALLARYLPNTTAWVYGSRVKWTSRPESDLDLVVFAKPEQERRVSDLREAFEESNLPFRVDLFVWDTVPEQFRKTIEAEHVVLVERREAGVGGEWRETTVDDIAASSRNALVGGPFGSNLVSRDYVSEGVPVIRGQNMGTRWVTGDFVFVTPKKAESLEANLARPGDIVLTQRGTLGQVSVVPSTSFGRYLVSQSQMKVTVNRQIADPLFFYYVLSSSEQQDYVRRNAIQTGVPHTNLGILRSTPVPVPPLKEQRTVAHILGTLDDKIELSRRMNQTLEEMARALFKSWFVDFDPVRAKATLKHHAATLPQGGSDWTVERARAYLDRMDPNIAALFPDSFMDSELGPIPKGWEVKALPEAIDFKEGPGIRNWQYTNSEEGIRFINIRCIQNGDLVLSTANRIKDEEAKGKYSHFHLREWDVVVSTSGTLGRSAIVRREHLPLVLNTSVIRFRPVFGKTLFGYVHGYLNSPMFLDELESMASGSVQKNFGPMHLKKMRVLCPSFICIKQYEDIAGAFLRKLIENRAGNDVLANFRDSLLPKLISGELREAKQAIREAI